MNYASKQKTFSDHLQDGILLIALCFWLGIMAFVCTFKPDPIPFKPYAYELSERMTEKRRIPSKAEIDSVRNYYIELLKLKGGRR